MFMADYNQSVTTMPKCLNTVKSEMTTNFIKSFLKLYARAIHILGDSYIDNPYNFLVLLIMDLFTLKKIYSTYKSTSH